VIPRRIHRPQRLKQVPYGPVVDPVTKSGDEAVS